ncbi:hypothetical protein ACFWWT_42450, partial [Streptomyces sp. NPDC058676]|uniref:hypothetical protein n=1 Tax=Streptomyces sp. NPDC058676 TaxID=3346593 RepID=UPI003646A4AA
RDSREPAVPRQRRLSQNRKEINVCELHTMNLFPVTSAVNAIQIGWNGTEMTPGNLLASFPGPFCQEPLSGAFVRSLYRELAAIRRSTDRAS